jgi:hypothetical protein
MKRKMVTNLRLFYFAREAAGGPSARHSLRTPMGVMFGKTRTDCVAGVQLFDKLNQSRRLQAQGSQCPVFGSSRFVLSPDGPVELSILGSNA